MTAERWSLIQSWFWRIQDLPEKDRTLRLEEMCQSDPELFEEVTRLLESDREAAEMLDHPAWGKGEPRLAPGVRLLDRFEIRGFLGAGGMGEVYEALDAALRETVALKVLRPEFSSNGVVLKRLQQEVRLARRISHPNVCRLYEFNRGAASPGEDLYFVTMEHLRGQTLSQRLLAGAIPGPECEAIAAGIIAGLQAAHDHGVIHRDFKSGNIMLAGERVVILDFGLAREAPDDEGREPSLRLTSQMVVGTPAYMAPEQIVGGAITTAVDIYALGVVLFEMAAGRLPFVGSSPISTMLRRLQLEPPRPREFNAQLDPQWEAAILACLERNPARRPASVAEVGRLLRGETRLPERLSNRAAQRTGAAAALLAAGLFLFAWLRTGPAPLPVEAAIHLKKAEAFAEIRTLPDQEKAEAEYREVLRLVPHHAPSWVGLAEVHATQANFSFREPALALSAARRAIEQALRLAPSSARANGIGAYIRSIDLPVWRTAGPQFERAVYLDPTDTHIRLLYGAYLGKLGKFDKALEQLDAGLRIDPTSPGLNGQRATTLLLARRFAEYHAAAVETVRMRPREPSSYHLLSRALEWQGRYKEALEACDEADRLGRSSATICYRALVEAAQGDKAAAARTLESLASLGEKGRPETTLLASVYTRLDQPNRALGLLEDGVRRNDSSVLIAAVSPYFEPLRGNARYLAFLRSIGW